MQTAAILSASSYCASVRQDVRSSFARLCSWCVCLNWKWLLLAVYSFGSRHRGISSQVSRASYDPEVINSLIIAWNPLIVFFSHHDQPTKEASAARKRLLESFAQYDRLSKEIRALSCPNGPGSSQDRVQAAIMTRANLFLQKNMFPLQVCE